MAANRIDETLPVPTTHPEIHRPRALRTSVIKFIFMFGVWVFLSGKFEVFHLSVGVVTAAVAVWLDQRLAPLIRVGRTAHIHPLRWIAYFLWLMGQMILSSLYVARVVLWPDRHLNPRLVRFRCAEPHAIAAVTLANSITLTPGTLTVDYADDHYLVHALTERTARDLLSGDMQARVARVFENDFSPEVVELSAGDTETETNAGS